MKFKCWDTAREFVEGLEPGSKLVIDNNVYHKMEDDERRHIDCMFFHVQTGRIVHFSRILGPESA